MIHMSRRAPSQVDASERRGMRACADAGRASRRPAGPVTHGGRGAVPWIEWPRANIITHLRRPKRPHSCIACWPTGGGNLAPSR